MSEIQLDRECGINTNPEPQGFPDLPVLRKRFSKSKRILGGIEAYVGQFPWYVRWIGMGTDGSDAFSCGGTIISK